MANYLGHALLWRYIQSYINGTDTELAPYTTGGHAGLAKFFQDETITPTDVVETLIATGSGDAEVLKAYVNEHTELLE